jgi:hypothetical protein
MPLFLPASRPLLVLLGLSLFARGASAAPTGAFERPGGGPRAAALGGHSVVLPDDDFALGTNPGRLVYAQRSASAQFDRIDPAIELWRGRLGFATPLGPEPDARYQVAPPRRAAVGVALDVTSLTLIEGSAYREAAISVGGAVAPISILGVGMAVRFEQASSDASGLSGHAFGVDVGGSMALWDHVAAGITLRNAFGRATFEGGDDEDRAAELTVGLAATHHRLWQAEVDYVFARNTTSALAGGAEVHVVPGTFDLRAGVAREMAGEGRWIPSAGAGFILSAFRIDYAFRSDTDGGLDAQHQLALGARF